MSKATIESGPRAGQVRIPRWVAGASQALAQAAQKARVISANTPLNLREELSRLEQSFASRPEAPRFLYEAGPDLSELRKALCTLGDKLEALGELGAIYAARARELADDATLCEEAGKPGLRAAARRRYGRRDRFDEAADVLARTWLEEPAGPKESSPLVQSDDERDPASLVRRLRDEIGRRKLPVRIIVSRNLASLAATGDGFVQVVEGRLLSRTDVERTVLHEIEGHVLPRLAASSARIGIFAVGSARGVDDQEGRALSLERAHGFLDEGRRRELALRHAASRSLEQSADFVATVRLLLDYGSPLPDALRIAARAHRGGGLGREAVYLPALLRVEAAVAVDPTLDEVLSMGRVSVEAAKTLRGFVSTAEIGARGLTTGH